MKLPDYQLICKSHEWQACLLRLKAEPRLAIDLEANSMFAYREKICLIQISIPDQDFILDPLAPIDLEPLGEIIADPAVEKILHASEYDLILMKREYDWELQNLFDTMWAARILGYKRYGLANLLDQFFEVKLNKRYQKSNWCQRPLSDAQLAYAQHDTHFLFRLRDLLSAEITSAGRETEAAEIFAQLTQVVLPHTDFDPDSFWQINGVQHLSKRQQAVLKEVHIFRDKEARRRNQPLFKIFNNRTALELAQELPRNQDDLHHIYGMTNGQVRRYGDKVLTAIKRGLNAPLPAYPRRHQRPPEAVLIRYEQLHNWRKQRARARGVESDVIISRDALWQIARQNPQSIEALSQLEGVGDWRCATYGSEILQVLQDSL